MPQLDVVVELEKHVALLSVVIGACVGVPVIPAGVVLPCSGLMLRSVWCVRGGDAL
jgi:uncharacterized membrane protein (DUF4010 family)